MNLIGYRRVSTSEQHESGLGLQAQLTAIQQYAAAHGHTLIDVITDVASGAKDDREGLERALAELRNGNADGIIVAKVDRLTRSLGKFGDLMETARREGWQIVAIDTGVDTTTPAGELIASIMASVAQWERRAIGQRTKDAMTAARERGVTLGRPTSISEETVRHICTLRATGMTYQAIADHLNGEGVAASRDGRQWWPSTVRKAALRAAR